MDNHVENLVALKKLALDIKGITSAGKKHYEQYLHIQELRSRISYDRYRFSNWEKLDVRFKKEMSFSANDFYHDLDATLTVLNKIEQLEPLIEKLCEYVGETEIEDARFMYTLYHDKNEIVTQITAAAKILSNFEENVLAVEKVYYKTFYSMRVTRKLPDPDDAKGFGVWTVIKSCLYPAIIYSGIYLFLRLIGMNLVSLLEFITYLPLPVLVFGGIASFISFLLDMGTTVWIYLLLILYAPFHSTILAPFIKLYFVKKGKKLYKSVDLYPARPIESDFPTLLQQTADLLEKMDYDSNVNYCPSLEKIGRTFIWNSRTIEEAAQKCVDAVNFGKEFVASSRSATNSTTSSSNTYSSYTPTSRSTSNNDNGSYNPLSYTPHNNLKERVGKMLQEKPYSTVAIFHSPVTNQWYRLNKYGQDEYVSIERTSSGDFFVARDGKSYKIKGIGADRESIYFYEST